ncbi:hypothetical protein Tsubulata_034661 [Turnera subulata]|uniref:Cyclin-dependent kinase inhibitor domain-containing protein n=1 Tax=Turnera subulata TaxID=218843 RepID=A0A9Q0FZP4_9ROSI|nr:hypothetical protein Tsubulata_034661 [Turnera subulata]
MQSTALNPPPSYFIFPVFLTPSIIISFAWPSPLKTKSKLKSPKINSKKHTNQKKKKTEDEKKRTEKGKERKMGSDCARDCKRSASVAVLESSSTSFSNNNKKTRVIDFDSEELTTSSPVPLKSFQLQPQQQCRLSPVSNPPEKAASPATSSSNSGAVLAGDVSPADSAVSLCSSNVSSEAVKDSFRFLDLEAKSFETEGSTCIDNKFSRETTPSSEFCGDTDDMDAPAAKKSHRRNSTAAAAVSRAPPEAEIEEFFAVAEKEEQKRFAEKYNYDIAKDAPLQGRYQWVRLKP